MILKISKNKSVSNDEIILLQGFVTKHSDILNLLKKAQCSWRLENEKIEDLIKFMADLSLKGTFQEEHLNPQVETIAKWSTNAPTWFRRI